MADRPLTAAEARASQDRWFRGLPDAAAEAILAAGDREPVPPPPEMPPGVGAGALKRWRREMAAGTRTKHTYDPLWRAACAELEAEERAEFERTHPPLTRHAFGPGEVPGG